MTSKVIQRLTKLRQTVKERGQFVVDAAAAQLLQDITSLDHQINVVGALHEVGYLRNSLAPYWKDFESSNDAWVHRCIARLVASDHDYWAVAALLGGHASRAVFEAKSLGFFVVAVRQYSRYDQPAVHIASMALKHDELLVPLLELGWDAETEELVDCARARAVLLGSQTTTAGSLIAEGSMSYFCRAALPHGSWRSVSLPFSIPAESVVPGASPNPSFKHRPDGVP